MNSAFFAWASAALVLLSLALARLSNSSSRNRFSSRTPAKNSTTVAATPAADNNLGTAVTPSLTSPPNAGVHVENREIGDDGIGDDAMDTT